MPPRKRSSAELDDTDAPAKKTKVLRRSQRNRAKDDAPKSPTSATSSTQIKPSDKSAKAEPKIKKNASTTKTKSSAKTNGTTSQDTEPSRPFYWLMKAEPESRIEKGKDVKFSIDDLAAVDKEPWDGVRNPSARNNMRAMRKGERAFFYHSNCKVPGIAGVMEIADEHSVDESAFDPDHPYYDEKSSRDNPKWSLVHVRFLKKFENLIPLKELQKHSQAELAGMQVLRMSRLSVSKVSVEEWRFVCEKLAGVDTGSLEALNELSC